MDYEHPENNGEPDWARDPNENFQVDPNFDEFGDYVNRSLSIVDILDETSTISPIHNILVNKHVFKRTPVDYAKLRPHSLVGSIQTLSNKQLTRLHNGE